MALAAMVSGMLLPGAGASAAPPTALVAGAATVSLELPAGTPLAGYGALPRRWLVPDILGRHPNAFWFRPHTAVRDPLAARALVLAGGEQRVIWLAVDLVAVDRHLTEALRRRLDLDPARDALIISASHTHSGPGGFIDSNVMGFVAVDRYAGAVHDVILDAMVAAVRGAQTTARAAHIGAVSVAAPEIIASRLGSPLDPELLVLKVAAPDGAPIALVWNFPIHGTMLGPRNLELSGDVMGRASHRLERAIGVPALYVNGAVGDVSPVAHGESAATAIAERLASAVEPAWRGIPSQASPGPRFTRDTVALGPPALSLRNCLGRWWPRTLALPLASVFPEDAPLVAGAVGDIAWVTVPGELQSVLGTRIKEAGRADFRHVLVAGLSNDYLGYFVRSEDWDRVSYVTCATFYGRDGGERLARGSTALLERLARMTRPQRAEGPRNRR